MVESVDVLLYDPQLWKVLHISILNLLFFLHKCQTTLQWAWMSVNLKRDKIVSSYQCSRLQE